MKITLLGHYDIASLYALNRLIGLLPVHNHTVLLSGEQASSEAEDPRLTALASHDKALSDRFLAGQFDVDLAAELSEQSRATLNNPNSPDGLQSLAATSPDLVVSIRYRRILRDDAIAIPAHGVLNLHSGILPDYRGVMATFWSMLDGASEIGTTLHRIVDSGIDTGPVIEICRRPTQYSKSYLANVLALYAGGCDTVASAVRGIASGSVLAELPQVSGGSYYSEPGSADVQRFEELELSLFAEDETVSR
ncbi:MAG: formyl transferase [Gammaproteobacteria bacterium]|nr:formyl transferase [Gammaproteobacteria bacterium]